MEEDSKTTDKLQREIKIRKTAKRQLDKDFNIRWSVRLNWKK